MAKVLVTGGAGFIGSHVVKKLVEIGEETLVVDNLFRGKILYLKNFMREIQFKKCDITEKDALLKIIKGFKPEIVIHLAALHFIPYCNANPEETFLVNVIGTRNLLECCKEINLKVFLFASTGATYPVKNGALKEDKLIEPIDIYGYTKALGEDLVRLFHLETGVSSIVCRLFNVYGPNETNPHVIPEILSQILSGKREIELGKLTPKRDYIHVYDVAEAIISLVNVYNGGFDIFNVGTGKEYSVKEIVKFCSEVIGEDIKIKQTKNRIREVDRMHLLADINKIKRMIKWSPRIKIKEGLKGLLEKDEKLE